MRTELAANQQTQLAALVSLTASVFLEPSLRDILTSAGVSRRGIATGLNGRRFCCLPCRPVARLPPAGGLQQALNVAADGLLGGSGGLQDVAQHLPQGGVGLTEQVPEEEPNTWVLVLITHQKVFHLCNIPTF